MTGGGGGRKREEEEHFSFQLDYKEWRDKNYFLCVVVVAKTGDDDLVVGNCGGDNESSLSVLGDEIYWPINYFFLFGE